MLAVAKERLSFLGEGPRPLLGVLHLRQVPLHMAAHGPRFSTGYVDLFFLKPFDSLVGVNFHWHI